MSYIRALQEPDWEEDIGTGLYVYSDTKGRIVGLPQTHRPFIEVVMRMLDQSDQLEEETLEQVHTALRMRLGVEGGTTGRTKPDLEDAYFGVSSAVAYCNDVGLDDMQQDLERIFRELEKRQRAGKE